MEGFVSKVCGLLRFFPVAMAAAAATPMGPEESTAGVEKVMLTIALHFPTNDNEVHAIPFAVQDGGRPQKHPK